MAERVENNGKQRNGRERTGTLWHSEIRRLLILWELLILRFQIKRPLLYH